MGEKNITDKVANDVSEMEEDYNDHLVRQAIEENRHQDFVEEVESGSSGDQPGKDLGESVDEND